MSHYDIRSVMVEHLYIHVPFCHRICPYCSFYKHTFGNINQTDLVKSVLNEISISNDCYEFNIKTIYLGGGTPTALSRKNLDFLLSGINKILNLKSLEEWGIEINPSTCDLKKARMIKDQGVTRTSLGIQSWNESTLKKLGRDHSPRDAEKSFEILKSCDFKSLNIDLMFSIPGQSIMSWKEDLNKTISLAPNHISAYNLNYEEDTEFFERLKKGDFYEDPEKDGDHFSLAMETLVGSGYEHYEISNYAQQGHRSKHNSSYWKGKDYLGIGPGAFSTVNGKRWRNVPDTKKYMAKLTNNKTNTIETEHEIIDDSSFRVERIALQLRTSDGLDLHYIKNNLDKAKELESDGLIVISNDTIQLTTQGKMLADSVASHLI